MGIICISLRRGEKLRPTIRAILLVILGPEGWVDLGEVMEALGWPDILLGGWVAKQGGLLAGAWVDIRVVLGSNGASLGLVVLGVAR